MNHHFVFGFLLTVLTMEIEEEYSSFRIDESTDRMLSSVVRPQIILKLSLNGLVLLLHLAGWLCGTARFVGAAEEVALAGPPTAAA